MAMTLGELRAALDEGEMGAADPSTRLAVLASTGEVLTIELVELERLEPATSPQNTTVWLRGDFE